MNGMARRSTNPNRRYRNLWRILNPKSRSPYLVPKVLAFLGLFIIIGYFFGRSGDYGIKHMVSKIEGDFHCTSEVHHTIPFLKTAYGDSMHKVLHVGPDTCSVVSKLIRGEDIEAWGIEPYEMEDEDADRTCKNLVRRGLVRVADIKFPLPYRAKSFSLVIISDAVDYLSPRYLNKTLTELARVSSDDLVIYAGYPTNSRSKGPGLSKFGRPAKMRSSTWWSQFFSQASLSENEAATQKFEDSATKNSYKSNCQIFHLKSRN